MVYLYFCRITECRIDRFSRQTFWLDAGVTNNVNDVPVLLKCPNKPWQWASAHGARPLKLRERNEIQPSLILLYAPVLLRPWRIKMSSQQKAQCPWSNSGLFLSSVWLAGEKKGETDRGIVCFTNLLWELVLAGRGACSYKPFVVWRRIWHWPPPKTPQAPTSLDTARVVPSWVPASFGLWMSRTAKLVRIWNVGRGRKGNV